MGRRPITGSAAATAATTPTSVPVTSIAHNPRNPRDHYDDIAELVASLQEVGVLQPLGVVRYEIFLTHYPQHEHEVGTYDWVVINGNRRLAAARKLGLSDVPVTVLDRLGRDDHLDEAVLIENIHREALPPLREAQALRLLVDRHGTQSAVAKRVGKTEGFVSQRLALLKLVPDLQIALSAGELTVEDARKLGKAPADRQVDEWARLRELYAVKIAPDETDDGHYEDGVTGVVPPQHGQPTSRPARASTRRANTLPSIQIGTPAEIAKQLRERLTHEDLTALVELLTKSERT